ncbi:MAG: lipocalin family protein [Candidatus Marinimicrobia bacterium]|nr:lipocalin family protein [Candidatus Neomarinimicrobiota bacterium]
MKGLMMFMMFVSSIFAQDREMVQEAVKNFELDKYLGTWYEIARLDHSFERGMSNVTAHYSLREDGRVKVLNKGYRDNKSVWKSATGIAKFTGEPTRGALRVSFFRPFYGGYNIVELDEDYSYALVAGDSEKYLWILSRTPVLDPDHLEKILSRGQALGYRIEDLIWVDQSLHLASHP